MHVSENWMLRTIEDELLVSELEYIRDYFLKCLFTWKFIFIFFKFYFNINTSKQYKNIKNN
jgi:hypothetical protein